VAQNASVNKYAAFLTERKRDCGLSGRKLHVWMDQDI
jgi:hypothetical protein